MYVCKARCKTTLYIHVGDKNLDLPQTRQLFEQQYKKTITDSVKVLQFENYKYWRNHYNEVAATATIEILVPQLTFSRYIEDYESMACRSVRRLLPTKGSGIQIISSEWLFPQRKKGYSKK